jgi:hypothetical protein
MISVLSAIAQRSLRTPSKPEDSIFEPQATSSVSPTIDWMFTVWHALVEKPSVASVAFKLPGSQATALTFIPRLAPVVGLAKVFNLLVQAGHDEDALNNAASNGALLRVNLERAIDAAASLEVVPSIASLLPPVADSATRISSGGLGGASLVLATLITATHIELAAAAATLGNSVWNLPDTVLQVGCVKYLMALNEVDLSGGDRGAKLDAFLGSKGAPGPFGAAVIQSLRENVFCKDSLPSLHVRSLEEMAQQVPPGDDTRAAALRATKRMLVGSRGENAF